MVGADHSTADFTSGDLAVASAAAIATNDDFFAAKSI
jgi:hypothetical protein